MKILQKLKVWKRRKGLREGGYESLHNCNLNIINTGKEYYENFVNMLLLKQINKKTTENIFYSYEWQIMLTLKRNKCKVWRIDTLMIEYYNTFWNMHIIISQLNRKCSCGIFERKGWKEVNSCNLWFSCAT